jgi:HEAT repeat protein
VGLTLLLAVAAYRLHAAPYTDPVEDLRNALRLDITTKDEDARKVQKAFREKNLKAVTARIESLGDLGRAVLLPDWRDLQAGDPVLGSIDAAIRDELLTRLRDRLRAALNSNQEETAWAAAVFTARLAEEARRNIGATKGAAAGQRVRESLAEVIPDLVKLTTPLKRGEKEGVRTERVQCAAAIALGQLEGGSEKEVVAALKALLEAGTPARKRCAAEALANRVRQLILLPGGERRKEMVEVGSEVVRSARAHLQDTDPEVQRFCADAILQSAGLLLQMVRLLPTEVGLPAREEDRFPPPERLKEGVGKNEEEEMRRFAQLLADDWRLLLPLLRTFEGSVPDLVKAAESRQAGDPVRIAVFRTLEQLGLAQDILARRWGSLPAKYLEKHLQDLRSSEKQGKRLPLAGSAELVAVAEEPPTKNMPDDPLRKGLQQAIYLLRGGLEADPAVILAALDVLEVLGPAGKEAAPGLNRALSNADPFVRRAAARVLGKIGPLQPGDVIQDIPAEVLNHSVTERLAFLLVNDRDLGTRTAAATALERWGPAAKGAADAAANVVANPRNDAEIRIAAARALISIGSDARNVGVPALIVALADSDVRVRREAAASLFRMGKDAAPARAALERAVNDSDPEVSRYASEAVLRIR